MAIYIINSTYIIINFISVFVLHLDGWLCCLTNLWLFEYSITFYNIFYINISPSIICWRLPGEMYVTFGIFKDFLSFFFCLCWCDLNDNFYSWINCFACFSNAFPRREYVNLTCFIILLWSILLGHITSLLTLWIVVIVFVYI